MQAIKYSWQEWKPILTVRDDSPRKMPLLGSDVMIKVGRQMCIGYFRDGKHFPCRNRREAEDSQCNECKMEDDYFFCIRCNGSVCINQKMRKSCEKNSYYVYLAAFNSMLKVGISYEFRLAERLVEQGADFGAKIARVRDGMAVRCIEQEIRKEMNIADRVTGTEKNEMLFCDPNVAVGNISRALNVLKGNGLSRYMVPPEIYDLREHYNLQNVLSQPKEAEIREGMTLEGRIVAAKGNLLILQKEKEFTTINAHRLIGRELELE